MCDCIKTMNALLAPYNTRLSQSFLLDREKGQTRTTLTISTEKIDKKSKKRCETVLPTFCPFCGEAIDVEARKRPSSQQIDDRSAPVTSD